MNGKAYPIGTKVQGKTGYIQVKTIDSDGKPKWEAESRLIWKRKKGELEEGDRVFHIDGDRENNDPSNLTKVHFSTTKFVMLKASRVLFMPKTDSHAFTNQILNIVKKRLGERKSKLLYAR